MRIALLGPVSVHHDDGSAVTVGGARLRALLALLALQPGRPVGPDRIVAGLWGDDPPAGATNALQSLVSRLRRALADDDPGTAPVGSVPAGYRLDVDPDRIDTHRFAALVADGRRYRLAGDTAAGVAALEAALRLWRGPALADVTAPFADTVVARLDADHRDALAELAETYLAADRPGDAAALLAEPAADHPLAERLCALRVRALHAAGRQAEALACYDRTRRALADELGVDPSAELAAVHLAVLRGPADTPAPTAHRPAAPAPAAEARRTNLRAALSSFIGRDRELTELRKLLADSRLVTLVGPGGTGKTRLAAEAAAGLVDAYPDGVWMVELAPVADPADLPNAALTALGAHAALSRTGPSGVTDRAEQLLAALADRTTLLVLDNCEHLIDAVARLTDTLLAHSPGVRILATSRAALSITGEKLYPVPTLEPPVDGADLTATRANAAVRLLTDRAAAVRPGFAVEADTKDAVGAICRRLDGAPLALELAAARLRALTPAELADRLDDRFRILTGGNRAALPRHQTLRAVVTWSWDLLDSDQRVLARRLSVFQGGATLAAIEAVCGDGDGSAVGRVGDGSAVGGDGDGGSAVGGDGTGDGGALPRERVVDALTGLVDQSLVEADDRAVTHYRMLETIRAYGAERLTAAAETRRARDAHLAYHLRLAETTEPALRTRDQDRAMATFTAEHDNLVAALRHAVDTGDVDSALRLGAALVWYWVLLGYVVDGGHWLREVIRVAPDEPPAGRATQYVICYIAAQLSELPEAVTVPDDMAPRLARFEHLAELARAEHTSNPLLRLLRVFPYAMRGDNAAARDELDGLVAAADDPWVVASALLMRAHMYDEIGDVDAAGHDAEQAVRRYREMGERWGLSMALVGLGEHLVARGAMGRAADVLGEAWQVASAFMPKSERPSFLVRLAGIRVRAGDVDTAERELAEAAALRVGMRPTHRFDWFQSDLVEGDIHRRRGRFDQARGCYTRVLDAMAEPATGPPQMTAIALAGLAVIDHDTGDDVTAAGRLDEALRLLGPSRDEPVLGVLLLGLILVAASTGEPERAAVLSGAFETMHQQASQHDPDLIAALDTARTALGADAFEAAARRGGDLEFLDLYDYLGVDPGEAGPLTRPQRPRPVRKPAAVTPSGGTPG